MEDILTGSNADRARIGEEPSPLLHPWSGPPAQVSPPAQSPGHLSARRLDSPQHAPSRRGRRSGSVANGEISSSAPRGVAVAVSVSIAVAIAPVVVIVVVIVVDDDTRDDPPLAPSDAIVVAVAVAVVVVLVVIVIVVDNNDDARNDPPLAPRDAIVVAVAVAVTAIVDDARRAVARREEEWERRCWRLLIVQ